MTITQTNNRYVVETEAGRLHILNENSLRWNLKKVFGFKPTQIAGIFKALATNGSVQIAA
jgi:hypothetical protein